MDNKMVDKIRVLWYNGIYKNKIFAHKKVIVND